MPENIDGALCIGGSHLLHLRPFGMAIHHDERHFVQERASKIHMYTLPGPRWPCPWVKRSRCWRLLDAETLLTTLSEGFQTLVNLEPPHMASSYNLHSGDPGVSVRCCSTHSMVGPQMLLVIWFHSRTELKSCALRTTAYYGEQKSSFLLNYNSVSWMNFIAQHSIFTSGLANLSCGNRQSLNLSDIENGSIRTLTFDSNLRKW